MSVGDAVAVRTAVEVGAVLREVAPRIGGALGTCGALRGGVAQAPTSTAATNARKCNLIERTTPPVAEVFCRIG